MMAGTLIPRLMPAEAIQIFSDHERQLSEGAGSTDLVDTENLGVANPTGGAVPDALTVQRWRREITGRLDGADLSTLGGQQRYGLVLGRAISEIIRPIKADAAHDGVWWYLSLRVFPDVVLARWPGQKQQGKVQLPADRWIGGSGYRDRNYLKLAWRRWMLLGDIMVTATPPLGEDEFVNLLERSAIARNKRLIREIAKTILEYGPGHPEGRSKFARELMKAICSRSGAVFLDLLDDREIHDLVQDQANGLLRSNRRRAAA